MKKLMLLALLLCRMALAGPGGEPQGEWTVIHLDDRHLALTGDYSDFLRRRFAVEEAPLLERLATAKLPDWQGPLLFDYGTANLIARYRPQIVRELQHFERLAVRGRAGTPCEVQVAGYWFNPTGQARFADGSGQERLTRNADIAHYLFLRFEDPLTPGNLYSVTLPTGEETEFLYQPDSQPSPLFKFDQVGYLPRAGRKYAYLGAWLGSGGPLPMNRHCGKVFDLCDADSGETVFSGVVVPRLDDPVNADGAPFSGEETAELDFSGFTRPGRYYLRVAGIGRSGDFRIDEKSAAEAFYCHARGLFHKRCNSADGPPTQPLHSHWRTVACHGTVFRGTFPPEIGHYPAGPAGKRRDYGFFDAGGNSITVDHFQLIRQNCREWTEALDVPGGWHDAADFDRRPQHMTIVGNLAAAWLIRPENFTDGQLNLPESGNGVPDILDEARWGLEHLRRGQQADGGVGTWIEAGRHPRPGEYLPSDDRQPYYLSLATRASSLEYAAYASMLALALRQAGDEEGAELYLDSARRAWDYALNPENRSIRFYQYTLNKRRQTILYREPKSLPAELLLKVGADLFLLTGERAFLEPALAEKDRLKEQIGRDSWRWPPFLWAELELFRDQLPEFDEIRRLRRQEIVALASLMLEQQEHNYPYRIAWYGPREAHVDTMSWGTCLPLNRALFLLAAHAFTGERKYFDGACLANDFHNGANPSGSTLTSGLGQVFPVRFLDLASYADGIAEFVPGITPYRYTYGISRDDVKLAHGLYYDKRLDLAFPGLAISLLPEALTGGEPLTESESAALLGRTWPVWRRWPNVEAYSVSASEYSVWETIAPAAAATGLLQARAFPPDLAWLERRPADDIRKLPGYAPLP